MDQGGSRNQDDLSQLIKKLTKLLLSVSVFSLFFSHTSLLSFLHSYNFYFSTFPFQLFSHAIDKNYMFLFCNGLLVFVAKFSGLISSPSSAKYNLTDEPFGNYEDVLPSKSVTVESELPLLEKEAVEEEINGALEDAAVMERREDDYLIEEEEAAAAEEEEDQGETEKLIVEDRGQEEESGLFIAKEEEEEEEEGGAFLLQDDGEIEEEYQEQEEEEKEEEELEELGNGMLSTEELNKKFDEFIRKMKEELKIEARQQLIMV